MSTSDALEQVIEHAVENAIRKALNINTATNRRLLSIKDTAAFLALSPREIYSMVATGDLPAVRHGRRKMVDVKDLDAWIERNKGNA